MLINEREARSVDGLRVAMYGIGSVGSTLTRMLVERGAEIVGALARSPEKQGRDVGDLIGLAAPLGVTVTLDPDELLATKPDIVVMTVASYMDDMYEHVERCIQAGTNVISLSEELLYPWHTSGDQAAALDAAAKAAGVTVACTGHQDGYWVSLVSVLMGTAFRIDTVEGVATWNVDDFGAELARDQLVGSTVADFEEWAATAERPPTFGRTSLHALAAVAGLTVATTTTTTMSEIAGADAWCEALQTTVPRGRLIGMTDVDRVTTEEGVELSLAMTGKVYAGDESDMSEWWVRGDSHLHLLCDGLPTHSTTCSTLVNRVEDVLDAAPGFKTLDSLPQLRYRPRSRSVR